MSLPIPRSGRYSEWRQRFLDCTVEELSAAIQDCLDYAERMDQIGEGLRAMCYRDVWPKLIRKRIGELSQEQAA